jgi:hypothetical protein
MYNRLKKLVNKVRAYGSKRWGDQRVIDRMLQAYAVKDTTMISLIQQDPTFKKMTPNYVLGKIINHEMLVEEAQHVKNLSKGIMSSKKQDIAFKATKKSKSKKVVEESSSEEEDDDSNDESSEYDPEEMALFIRRFSKLMGKQKVFKGDKKNKFKSKTKRACYNYGKYDHYITNCPYEHREEDDDKRKKKEKSYKKYKHYKKKTYGETHICKEWNFDDDNFDSNSDGVATIAIKGSSTSSNKSLFPNLNKGKPTCLMAKESKKMVKYKSSPSKYVSSDDELDSSEKEEDEETLLNAMCKNPKERMKGLLKEIRIHDELLDQQEKLLVQERESNQELKKLLKLEKEKNENFDQELTQSKETISSLKSSSGALQNSYDVLQKTHKDIEVQFDALWSSTSKPSNNNKASTSQLNV